MLSVYCTENLTHGDSVQVRLEKKVATLFISSPCILNRLNETNINVYHNCANAIKCNI